MLAGYALLVLLCTGFDGHNDQDKEIASLVDSLGSARYADRQRATDTLLRMGDEVRPALDAARSARDPEVRERAAWLIEAIDGLGLTRPSQIQIDLHDRPLAEVALEIGRQAGIDLVFPASLPGQNPSSRKPVSLRLDSPTTFWTAIDKLREASGLSLAIDDTIGRREGRGIAELRVERSAALATAEDGPIRGEVVGFSRRGDLGFLAQVRLRAEPRLRLRVTGQPRDVEARDEFGRTLAAISDPLRDPSEVSFAETDQAGGLLLWIPMERPVDLGQTLKHFAFSVPVALATRRDEPSATISFGEVDGKAQVLEDVVVIARRPNVMNGFGGRISRQVQLLIRGVAPERRPDLGDDQLELRDTAGRLIPTASGNLTMPWRAGMGGRGLSSQNVSFRTYNLSGDDRGFPAEVRYYGLRQTETVVTLEFHDVPLPAR